MLLRHESKVFRNINQTLANNSKVLLQKELVYNILCLLAQSCPRPQKHTHTHTHHFSSLFFVLCKLNVLYLPHNAALCSRGHYIYTKPRSGSSAITWGVICTMDGVFQVIKMQSKEIEGHHSRINTSTDK